MVPRTPGMLTMLIRTPEKLGTLGTPDALMMPRKPETLGTLGTLRMPRKLEPLGTPVTSRTARSLGTLRTSRTSHVGKYDRANDRPKLTMLAANVGYRYWTDDRSRLG